ncbi:flagellar basal body rod protein FlgC [Actinophytocola xanthii]|nr:flagellar basal-body rod protein FlgC [Actinophytocola xanthii]
MFDNIGVAASGVAVYRKWLDAVSDNIANINDASPTTGPAFQERFIQAQPIAGDFGGAVVASTPAGNAEGRLVLEPNHPLADEQGYVRYPDMDLSEQMGYLIMAQRGYQANLAVADRAHGAYEAALQLGKNA